MATEENVKVMVLIGTKWVPAHLGDLTPTKAKRLCAAYRLDRPDTEVKIVGSTNG